MEQNKTNALALSDLEALKMAQAALAEAGIDATEEVESQKEGVRPALIQVKVEHSDTGKHGFYLDMGIGDDGIILFPKPVIDAVVVFNQHVRAYWPKDSEDKLPKCAAIEGMPYVDNPVNETCKSCPKNGYPGECKPKVRTLILIKHPETGEIGPVVFNVPTTSIKNWDNFILSLGKWPLVAMNTQFSLEDKQKDKYRWAIVKMKAQSLADASMINKIKEMRSQYDEIFSKVHAEDFSDEGDRGFDPIEEVPAEPDDQQSPVENTDPELQL